MGQPLKIAKLIRKYSKISFGSVRIRIQNEKKGGKRKECFEIEVWKETTKDRKRRAKEKEKIHG